MDIALRFLRPIGMRAHVVDAIGIDQLLEGRYGCGGKGNGFGEFREGRGLRVLPLLPFLQDAIQSLRRVSRVFECDRMDGADRSKDGIAIHFATPKETRPAPALDGFDANTETVQFVIVKVLSFVIGCELADCLFGEIHRAPQPVGDSWFQVSPWCTGNCNLATIPEIGK